MFCCVDSVSPAAINTVLNSSYSDPSFAYIPRAFSKHILNCEQESSLFKFIPGLSVTGIVRTLL
jgi:hypothetical protein